MVKFNYSLYILIWFFSFSILLFSFFNPFIYIFNLNITLYNSYILLLLSCTLNLLLFYITVIYYSHFFISLLYLIIFYYISPICLLYYNYLFLNGVFNCFFNSLFIYIKLFILFSNSKFFVLWNSHLDYKNCIFYDWFVLLFLLFINRSY